MMKKDDKCERSVNSSSSTLVTWQQGYSLLFRFTAWLHRGGDNQTHCVRLLGCSSTNYFAQLCRQHILNTMFQFVPHALFTERNFDKKIIHHFNHRVVINFQNLVSFFLTGNSYCYGSIIMQINIKCFEDISVRQL